MKTKFLFFFVLFVVLVSLACVNSAPTPTILPPTQTPVVPTNLPTATETSIPTTLPPTHTPAKPLPTATATDLLASPTPALRVLDFRQWYGISLAFDLLSPDTLHAHSTFDDYQSTDGGVTWNQVKPDVDLIEITRTSGVGYLQRDPHTPTILYGINEALQTFVKSTDGGQTWTAIPLPFDVMGLTAGMSMIEIAPRNPGVIFASDILTIYKSVDGGETWREIMVGVQNPASSGFMDQQFDFDPSSSDTVYFIAGIHGPYRSTNGGEQWQLLSLPRDENGFFQGFAWLTLDPQDSETLYAGSNAQRFYQSADGGQTWTETDLGLPSPDVYAFAIAPLNPSIRYAILASGETSGLFKSEDGGATWVEIATTLLP